MGDQIFQELTNRLDEAVASQEVPGAVMGVIGQKGLVYKYSEGFAHKGKNLLMKEDTVFDLASLTKVTATLPSILKLLEAGEIDLKEDVSHILSEIKFQKTTIERLLHHTTGLPSFYPFFRENITDSEEILQKIADLPKESEDYNQVIYSDLNFILLGLVVEKVTGLSLERFANQEIYRPLGMEKTYFNPPEVLRDEIAATEFREELSRFDHGYVHDENARCFGGVSGHAGLFSTLDDLAKFARFILRPHHSKNQILKEETIRLSIDHKVDSNLVRGLGWQFNDQGTVGDAFSPNSFGHTGFTGTSIWFDEHRQFAVIILTNRVHFGRSTSISAFRQDIHNIVYRSLNKKR